MIRRRDIRWSHILFAESQLTQVVGHEVQVPEAQSLAGEKTVDGSWPIDAGELEASEADAAAGGCTKSHYFILNNRECATVPYLARQLSVFCKPD